jgi:hypothetical protein
MSEVDPVVVALQARLEAIEQEIDRLTRLAAAEDDYVRRQQYWDLARDVQAEARKLRGEFSGFLSRSAKHRRRSLFYRLRNTLKLHRCSAGEFSVTITRPSAARRDSQSSSPQREELRAL